MKIEIEYPACALDTEETLIDDIQILSSISTREDKSANLSDYLSSIFEDLGVSGGKVKLKVKPDTKSLSSVVIYDIDEPLSKVNLQLLIEETTGQLTDGYGEDSWEINDGGRKFYVSLIDLFSGKKSPISVSTLQEVSFIKKARRSPIFSAIEKDDIAKARKYLDKSHLFSTDKWDATPLMCAISYDQTDLAIKMIELGANVNHLAEKSGSTPLSRAAMAGDIKIGQALIDYGVDINNAPKDPDGAHSGMTALMWAANRNHRSFVELLLKNDADINMINQSNQTALMFADNGSPEQLEIFELIIKRKPVLNIKDWRGRTIIDQARDRSNNSGKPEMKNLIIQYFPELSFE